MIMHSSFIQIPILLILFCHPFTRCMPVSEEEVLDPRTTLGFAESWLGSAWTTSEIKLHDLRNRDSPHPRLEENGFTWLTRPVKDLCYLKPFSVDYTNILRRDSVSLVKELTGSKMAVCYAYAERDGSNQSSIQPYPALHSDLSLEGANLVKKDLQNRYHRSWDESENQFGQSIKAGKRVVIYNVWRPVEVVKDHPLAICYWNSLKEDDTTDPGLVVTSRENGLQTWKYGDHQKWAYLSDMRPEEAFVFMQHDSHGKDRHGINVPHASVELQGQEGKPSTRKSYDFKIAVIMDDEPGRFNKALSTFLKICSPKSSN